MAKKTEQQAEWERYVTIRSPGHRSRKLPTWAYYQIYDELRWRGLSMAEAKEACDFCRKAKPCDRKEAGEILLTISEEMKNEVEQNRKQGAENTGRSRTGDADR